VKQTLAELGGQFDVVRTDLPLGGRVVRMHHPRNADELIDEDAFAVDERLPYWADIWPSARVLADRVAAMRVDERRLLELGCGAGLVSVAAAMAGFEVTATDYYDEALRFTALNVLVNTGT
jgi:predicted nicotinamide N-methyase